MARGYSVTIFSSDDQTCMGEGTVEGISQWGGQVRLKLRVPPGLEVGEYVVHFETGERWAVETLSEPGGRWWRFGGWVGAKANDPPPISPPDRYF